MLPCRSGALRAAGDGSLVAGVRSWTNLLAHAGDVALRPVGILEMIKNLKEQVFADRDLRYLTLRAEGKKEVEILWRCRLQSVHGHRPTPYIQIAGSGHSKKHPKTNSNSMKGRARTQQP